MTQMTQTQIQSLSSTDITGLTTTFMEGRTSTELGFFSLLQFQHFTSTQLGSLTATAIVGISTMATPTERIVWPASEPKRPKRGAVRRMSTRRSLGCQKRAKRGIFGLK